MEVDGFEPSLLIFAIMLGALSFNHNLQPESIGHSPGWLKVNKAADQEQSQQKFSAQLRSVSITMQKSICPTRISTAGNICFLKNWCHIYKASYSILFIISFKSMCCTRFPTAGKRISYPVIICYESPTVAQLV